MSRIRLTRPSPTQGARPAEAFITADMSSSIRRITLTIYTPDHHDGDAMYDELRAWVRERGWMIDSVNSRV